MHAADLDSGAAVGFTVPASDTLSAIEIGDEGNDLPLSEIRRAVDIDQLGGKFVTQDAGIIKKRLRALESMEVGTADSYTLYFQEGMIFGEFRHGRLAVLKMERGIANQCFHRDLKLSTCHELAYRQAGTPRNYEHGDSA